ncbi:hypothetical protein CPB83DRAFT_851818 [Crepidotus variabilis]|uniref:Beta-glucuronidase C-terminal domain-containing protein n=1 Tax=Crepidotus variabilis TaxID=179855 RepID=A0A9P6JR51_9AGAR|nr:hypothetical protein CPB83DRAFT_851818 [Crepidotus variabilis]
MLWYCVLVLASAMNGVQAVTVYGQLPLAQTNTAPAPAQTTLAAYNDTVLTPPQINNPPPRQYTLSPVKDAAAVTNLSIPHVGGSFWGFSIETSVVSQVMGKNSSFIAPTFLNLMSNLVERASGVVVRIGGNTQEFAVMVDSLPSGKTFGKADSGSNATTKTPSVLYTRDMFYMCGNVSSMLNVKWFMGIPFNDSVNWRLTIMEEGQRILGDNLLAFQAGNEPDFYVDFGRRQAPYNPPDYNNDLSNLIKTIDANPNIPVKNQLLGPSIATGPWVPQQVWDTGFMDTFKDRMYAFTVEHYPDNNCVAMFGTAGTPAVPQSLLPLYLTHKDRVVDLVSPYTASANLATAHGKPFIMFETNTGSCGGFPGISDTFASALWATDYGLQMAYNNFTHALMHIGGQNVFYNPFTSPPTNQSAFNQWTIGPIYYSTVIVAEALGKSNTSQVVDLNGNNGNLLTPSYAIYENDILSKVALFNYVDDQSGASTLQVTINVPNGNPPSVKVKYLLAETVSTKYNVTWAGQTLGNKFQSDGRFKGALNVTTIACGGQGCTIPVPAPGFALVFMDSTEEVVTIGQATQTFATTAHTNAHNTAASDPTAVASSNGHSGADREGRLDSTNYGKVNGKAAGRRAGSSEIWTLSLLGWLSMVWWMMP